MLFKATQRRQSDKQLCRTMDVNGILFIIVVLRTPVCLKEVTDIVVKPSLYKLMELLLDRKLGAFAEELHKSYTDSILPKIYGEAVLQYYYSSGKPFATGQNGAMEADFRDFNEMRMATADERERYNNLKRVYGNTYWFYFRYGK